jgi:hypothetical protein
LQGFGFNYGVSAESSHQGYPRQGLNISQPFAQEYSSHAGSNQSFEQKHQGVGGYGGTPYYSNYGGSQQVRNPPMESVLGTMPIPGPKLPQGVAVYSPLVASAPPPKILVDGETQYPKPASPTSNNSPSLLYLFAAEPDKFERRIPS